MIAALIAFAAIGWFAAATVSMQLRQARLALADSERLVASVKASYTEYRAHVAAQQDLVRRVVVPPAQVVFTRSLAPDFALRRRVN